MPEIIDDFEDGDLSEYTTYEGESSISQSELWEGNYSMEHTTDGASKDPALSTSGLPYYPSAGDDPFRVHFRTPNAGAFVSAISWGNQSEANSGERASSDGGYFIELRYEDNEGHIGEENTGRLTTATLDSEPQGTWCYADIHWQSDGTMDVYVRRASDDNLVFSATMTDTSYSSGGVGWGQDNSNANTATMYYDLAHSHQPNTPSNLSATESSGMVELTWNDESKVNTGYRIYRSSTSGSSLSDYTLLETISGDSSSYTDSAPNDDNYYRVVAEFESFDFGTTTSDMSNEAYQSTDGNTAGWSSPTDWDNAQAESRVVHETYGDFDGSNVRLGYPSNVKSPTHHWPLYEDSGSVVNDVIGSGDGETFGPTIGQSSGPFGQTYYYFDGTDDYIALDDTISSSGEIPACTINLWVRSSASYPDWSLLDYDRSESVSFGFDTGDSSADLRWATTDSSGSTHDLYSANEWNDGNWHMVTAVYDGTDKYIYVDATQEVSASNPHGGNNLGTGTTRYGCIGDGSEMGSYNGSRNERYYEGDMAFVMFWKDTALTQSELQNLYDYASSGRLTTGTKSP